MTSALCLKRKDSMWHVISNAWVTARRNQGLIIVTFEVFWIIVFLLDRIGPGTTGGVPQFVYVNF